MPVCYIAVGSNIDPGRNIKAALRLAMKRFPVLGSSRFYRTSPIDRPEQQDFRNGIWQIKCDASAGEIKFDMLRRIESVLGRQRSTDKYAAREIDLDLILYGRIIIRDAGLTIPDPDIRRRAFIALPLAELDPELVLPDTGERIADICKTMNCQNMQLDLALSDALTRIINEEEPK